MFDVTNEKPISLEKARHLPAVSRDGHPRHYSTVRGWVDFGIRGIKLESAEQPQGTVTSELAVLRFIERLTAAASTPAVPKSKGPTPKQREKAIARAMAAVAAM